MPKQTVFPRAIAICLFALTLSATLGFYTCNTKKVDALVGCSHIGKLQTGMGLLNVPQELIGNVIVLDPASHATGFGGRLNFADGDLDKSSAEDTTDLSDSSALSINFSADLPATVKVTLSSALTDATQLHLEKSERHQFKRPGDLVNSSDNQKFITKLIDDNPNTKIVLVDAGVAAQKVTFALKNGTQNTVNVNVPGTGDFELSVNYSCQGDLNQTVSAEATHNIETFFKVDEIQKNADGSLAIKVFTDKLNDYDFSNGLHLKSAQAKR